MLKTFAINRTGIGELRSYTYVHVFVPTEKTNKNKIVALCYGSDKVHDDSCKLMFDTIHLKKMTEGMTFS